MWKKAFALLQQMGKALMLPVSVLPVAGLLLGLGSAKFSKPETFFWMPNFLAEIMKQAGDAIFANLPLIFAVSVAIGFTGNDGVSALAATVGFAVFVAALGAASVTLWGVPAENLDTVMGLPSLNTGVFGGLIMGCVAAYLFNRYFRIQLPQYLGFFAGKRFVPIVTALAAIVIALLEPMSPLPLRSMVLWSDRSCRLVYTTSGTFLSSSKLAPLLMQPARWCMETSTVSLQAIKQQGFWGELTGSKCLGCQQRRSPCGMQPILKIGVG
jgi:phosphotransferase system  glucose/maltose/N-acetylglucosamine-specific IIC component